MKIPNIDFNNFKELEGKLNTWIIMISNDGEGITLGEIMDFVEVQAITPRQKNHLCLSAGIHLGIILSDGRSKMVDKNSNTVFEAF